MLAQGAAPLAEGVALTGEVRWALAEETPQRLEDLIYRRLRAAWFSPQKSGIAFWPPRQRTGEALGWSPERKSAEIERVRARLAHELAFKGLALAPKPWPRAPSPPAG